MPDTPENRRVQAQRYLEASPPKQLFADMTKNMSASVPAAQRDKVMAMFSTAVEHLDMTAVTKDMEDTLVKRFTAEELKAMADFYGSPIGKSIMSKMGGLHRRPDAAHAGPDDEIALGSQSGQVARGSANQAARQPGGGGRSGKRRTHQPSAC